MCVGEAMRFALNSLAVGAFDWLIAHSEEEWLYRYGHRIEEARLPASRTERQALAELIGRDGATLLAAIFDPAAPQLLREIPAIEILRQIWIQNYFYEEGQLRWRSNEDIPPPARYISSPYDRQARYSKKRSTTWVGYKVHLGYDNDSYNFGPFVPPTHYLPLKCFLLLRRVSFDEPVSSCCFVCIFSRR